jgi:hypothetical protein
VCVCVCACARARVFVGGTTNALGVTAMVYLGRGPLLPVQHFAGANIHGQLGDGSTANSAVPVAVSGGGTWSAVSTGWNHTCGLKSGGALFCWGESGGVGHLYISSGGLYVLGGGGVMHLGMWVGP